MRRVPLYVVASQSAEARRQPAPRRQGQVGGTAAVDRFRRIMASGPSSRYAARENGTDPEGL